MKDWRRKLVEKRRAARMAMVALVACWLNIIIAIIATGRGMYEGWDSVLFAITVLCLVNALGWGKMALWLSGEGEKCRR